MHRRTTFYKNNNNNNNNNDNRRSSGYIKSHSSLIKKDPRPIKDKSWQNKKIEGLIEYLTNHGYNSTSLSKQALNPPSMKTFKLITTFLFKEMDNSIELENFEEDVISILSKLGYPFKLSKGMLRSAATPHTWPTILAALAWLLELLIVCIYIYIDI